MKESFGSLFLPKWKEKGLIRRENGKRNVRWEVLVKS